jgi:hypothetical protein
MNSPKTALQLPRNVIAFLCAHIDHVVKLKLVLYLHQNLGRGPSMATTSHVLGVSASQVRDMANELAADGLLRVSDDQLELVPTIDDRLTLADLAAWYAIDSRLVIDILRAIRPA